MLTGNNAYDGVDPDGQYAGSPSAFTVTDEMTIEADIDKKYRCSDHFFVITSSPAYRPWSWGSETNAIKVVWDCNDLKIIGPSTTKYGPSPSVNVHPLTIKYSLSNVRVTDELDKVDISLSGSYWNEVWIWIGADDDEHRGSDFSKVMIYNCLSGIQKI